MTDTQKDIDRRTITQTHTHAHSLSLIIPSQPHSLKCVYTNASPPPPTLTLTRMPTHRNTHLLSNYLTHSLSHTHHTHAHMHTHTHTHSRHRHHHNYPYPTITNLHNHYEYLKGVALVELMYFVFTHMPGESYHWQLRSLSSYDVFCTLINSLVVTVYTSLLFENVTEPSS